MISKCTSSVPNGNVVFPRLLYCDSRCSQTCCQRSQMLPGLSMALPCAPNILSSTPRCSQIYHNHSPGSPVPVIRDLMYTGGRQECPPRVWYSPGIDALKFTLHILSDTPAVFQWLIYILLILQTQKVAEYTARWTLAIGGGIHRISFLLEGRLCLVYVHWIWPTSPIFQASSMPGHCISPSVIFEEISTAHLDCTQGFIFN